MDKFETVEVLDTVVAHDGDENELKNAVKVTLELQRKLKDSGKQSRPYPILDVSLGGKKGLFLFVDYAVKLHEALNEILPKAKAARKQYEDQRKADQEEWESNQKHRKPPRGNSDSGATARRREKEQKGTKLTYEQRKSKKSKESKELREKMRRTK